MLLKVLSMMVEGDRQCIMKGGGRPTDNCLTESRRKVLEYIVGEYSSTSSERFAKVLEYLKDVEESLGNSGLDYLSIKMTTRSNMVLGWSPLYFVSEVPIAWDMILDTFYVPASAVKGIVKSSLSVAGSSCVEELMGSRDGIGRAIVLDAYPVGAEGRALTLDVLTPHYRPEVRDGNEYDVRPIPIPHVVVSPGVRFRTFLAYRPGGKCDARRELEEALRLSAELGWGRRTTRGYGVMEVSIS
jgi:CRISPR-associated protein Cmr6